MIISENPSLGFNEENSMFKLAKHLINVSPGIYEGNLRFWLKDSFEASELDIRLCFLELMKEEYFFSISYEVFPPNYIKPSEKFLNQFVMRNDLLDVDLEIFLFVEKLGKKAQLSEVSRKVVSYHTDYSERQIIFRIEHLLQEEYILPIEENGSPEYLKIHWDKINEEFE